MKLGTPVFSLAVKDFKGIALLHQEKNPSRELLANLELIRNSFNLWFNSAFFENHFLEKLEISRVVGLNEFENSENCFHSGTRPHVEINPNKIFDVKFLGNDVTDFKKISILDNFLLNTLDNISFKNYRVYDLALMDESLLVHVELENNCIVFPFYVFNTWLILNNLIENNGKYSYENIHQLDGDNIYTPSINLFLPGLKGLMERSALIKNDNIALNYIYNGVVQGLLPELDGKFNFSKTRIDQVFYNVQTPQVQYSPFKYFLVKQYRKVKSKSSSKKSYKFFFKNSKSFMSLLLYLNSLEKDFSLSNSNLEREDQLALRALVRWKKYQQ